jgi:hypothetical protein
MSRNSKSSDAIEFPPDTNGNNKNSKKIKEKK